MMCNDFWEVCGHHGRLGVSIGYFFSIVGVDTMVIVQVLQILVCVPLLNLRWVPIML